MSLIVVHHPAFTAPLPPGHRFPMEKFGRLISVIRAEGLTTEAHILRPDLADQDDLCLVHAPAYVKAVFTATVPQRIEREIGLPIDAPVALRSRAACGGTLRTARESLARGIACNTAGGSHHAGPEQGAGFCVFNDVAYAARVLLRERRVARVLIIDLDVHQGDGTAKIFSASDNVFTFSMHAARNYPVRKALSDLDVALADNLGDKDYLDILNTYLPGLIAGHRPDLIFYNAGVDPWVGDRLGRLALSYDGLAERDRRVMDAARSANIPIACVIGGGYSDDIDEIANRHAILHRTARQFAEP